MANDWSAMVNTTTKKYLKGATDLTIRERVLFAMLQRRKRITYGHSGTDVQHQVKFSLPETSAYTGGVIDFQPSDKYRSLSFDWRSYVVSDAMDEKEKLMNRGVPALIKRYTNIMKDMRQSLIDEFGTEIFNDGYTNSTRLCGIESFMGADGNTVVGDRIANPSDTYGGRSTALGAEAGSWGNTMTTQPNATLATDWPSGKGDPEYDYLSPRLFNSTSTGWGTGSNAWIDNCERVIRQAQLWTRLTTGRTGSPEICLLSDDYYYDYENKQEVKQRIMVPHKEVHDLGFEGVRQEGISILTEFGMTPSTGYIINCDKCELRCMYDQLFSSMGPEKDINTLAWKFLMGFFGNMVWEPKFFGKIYPYAAS